MAVYMDSRALLIPVVAAEGLTNLFPVVEMVVLVSCVSALQNKRLKSEGESPHSFFYTNSKICNINWRRKG